MTQLPIRLLRCPDRSLPAKPAQRATDGRPYELKSVPTKTVAIRTTGNCSDLVQKLCQHPCLPLRGEGVGASRRMRWNSIRALAHTSIIHYSLFTIHLQAQPAAGQCPPLRIGFSADENSTNGTGKISSLQGMAQCRGAMQKRIVPHLRHRADAIRISVSAAASICL